MPHSETERQIAVDMDHHKSMTELRGRVAGSGVLKEVIVGWYSSSAKINPYSALIHNFFAQETGPSTPAIHLTVDTEALANGNADGALAVKAYVATIRLRRLVSNSLFPTKQSSTPSIAVLPVQTLSQSLQTLTAQIGQIQNYVSQFASSPASASASDVEVGKYLLDAVGRWKAEAKVAGSAEEEAAEQDEDDEEGVKKGLQDALGVIRLSAHVRSR